MRCSTVSTVDAEIARGSPPQHWLKIGKCLGYRKAYPANDMVCLPSPRRRTFLPGRARRLTTTTSKKPQFHTKAPFSTLQSQRPCKGPLECTVNGLWQGHLRMKDPGSWVHPTARGALSSPMMTALKIVTDTLVPWSFSIWAAICRRSYESGPR